MTQGHRPHRAPGPAPTAEDLHESALAYLARYAASEAGLRRVLLRRIARWADRARAEGLASEDVASSAAAARDAVRGIVGRLAATGALNDAAFAKARAERLVRGGRSRRAVSAMLAAKGIDATTARAALPADGDAELAAALVLARRRRLGPFRQQPSPQGEADAETRRRELGVLARAGFPRQIALCALGMDAATAEALVLGLRRS